MIPTVLVNLSVTEVAIPLGDFKVPVLLIGRTDVIGSQKVVLFLLEHLIHRVLVRDKRLIDQVYDTKLLELRVRPYLLGQPFVVDVDLQEVVSKVGRDLQGGKDFTD